MVWDRKVYDPFLGWTTPDFAGRRRPRGRRRAPLARSPRRRVARGVPRGRGSSAARRCSGSFQRDEPHDPVGRRAPGRRRRHPRARGQPRRLAYTNWQEVLLLERLLSKGQVPDAVVFYDGFNEILSQFQLGPHDEPSHVGAADTAVALRQFDAERAAGRGAAQRVGQGQRRPPRGRGPSGWRARWASTTTSCARPGPGRSPTAPSSAGPTRPPSTPAASSSRAGWRRSYGFQASFFWQPSVYTQAGAPGRGVATRATSAADPPSWRAADPGGARPARARRPRPGRRPRRRAQPGAVRLRPHERGGRARGGPAPLRGAAARRCAAWTSAR